MLEPKQEFINLRVNKCKEALEKQHIKTYITENKEEANQLVNSLIEDHSLVCDGGSMSLRGRVCQDTFCGFSKLNDLSVKKSPKTSCLQMS